jgi:hypothetical protein
MIGGYCNQREIAAYHEAGHAVIALALSVKRLHVSIEPEGDSLGRVRHLGLPGPDDDSAVLISLAGPFAQRRFAPDSEWLTSDIATADEIVAARGGSAAEKASNLASLCEHAVRIVDHFWEDISVTANALLKRTTMTGEEITSGIRSARRSSRRRCRAADPPEFALVGGCASCGPRHSD